MVNDHLSSCLLEANHHLEEEGDIIWQTSIEILCCPYCGVALAAEGLSEKPCFGARKSFSFSSWNGVEL